MKRIPYVKWCEAVYEMDENGELTVTIEKQYTIGEVLRVYRKILPQLTRHDNRFYVERMIRAMCKKDPSLPALAGISDGGS